MRGAAGCGRARLPLPAIRKRCVPPSLRQSCNCVITPAALHRDNEVHAADACQTAQAQHYGGVDVAVEVVGALHFFGRVQRGWPPVYSASSTSSKLRWCSWMDRESRRNRRGPVRQESGYESWGSRNLLRDLIHCHGDIATARRWQVQLVHCAHADPDLRKTQFPIPSVLSPSEGSCIYCFSRPFFQRVSCGPAFPSAMPISLNAKSCARVVTVASQKATCKSLRHLHRSRMYAMCDLL